MDATSIEVLRLVATTVAAAVALRQYLRAQAWKRLEFVAREAERFRQNPSIGRVLVMLIWESSTIDLGWDLASSQSAVVTLDLIIKSLQLPDGRQLKTNEVEALVRHQFETFIEYLEHFENVIAAGLVKPRDLFPYLEHVLATLSGNGRARTSLLKAFWTFADSYGHEKARTLVRRFHPSLPETMPEVPSLRAVVGRIGGSI